MRIVGDSQQEREEANLESMDNLNPNLEEQGSSLEQIPYVVQYNKRDLPNVIPVQELRKNAQPNHVPDFESVASQGRCCFRHIEGLAKMVLIQLRKLSKPCEALIAALKNKTSAS